MEKKDGRNSSPDEQYRRREEVINLRMKGWSNKKISEAVGIFPSHVSTIWRKYLNSGVDLDTLKPEKRGRRYRLTDDQERIAKELLIDMTPDQLGLDCHLWDRDTIHLAIRNKVGVELPARTLSDYLRRWGLTTENPNKHVGVEGQEKWHCWLESDYREILAKSKKENAEIHWCRVTSVRASVDRTTLKNNALFVRPSTESSDISMISTITNQGKVRFMLFKGKVKENLMMRFLTRLTKDLNSKRKAFVIMDDYQMHDFNFDSYVKLRKNEIKIFYNPDYSSVHSRFVVKDRKDSPQLLSKRSKNDEMFFSVVENWRPKS